MLIIFCVLFLSILELINYSYYIEHVKPKEINNKNLLNNKSILETYSKYISDHFHRIDFLSLFKKYYGNIILTKRKINVLIKKHLFNLSESKIKNHNVISKINYANINDSLIPDDMISVHALINQLTNKYTSMYIMNKINYDTNDKIINWNNLSSNIKYKSFFNVLHDRIKYYRFCKTMYNFGLKYTDINNYIRIWYSDMSNKQIVILNQDDSNPIDNNKIYVEMRRFTHYSEIYDLFTFNVINGREYLDFLARQYNDLFNAVRKYNDKIDIISCGVGTIIIPLLLKYYHEHINQVFLTDPVIFLNDYYRVFKMIDKTKYLSNYTLMLIFNEISFIDIYYLPIDSSDNYDYSKDVYEILHNNKKTVIKCS